MNTIKNILAFGAGVLISAAAIKGGKEFGSSVCNTIKGDDPKSFRFHYAKVMGGVDDKSDYRIK